MKYPRQPGLFDVEERAAQLTKMGDPLVGSNARIGWEAFRSDLNRVHEKDRKSQSGAKPFDVVLMFKVLVLQQLHNLICIVPQRLMFIGQFQDAAIIGIERQAKRAQHQHRPLIHPGPRPLSSDTMRVCAPPVWIGASSLRRLKIASRNGRVQ